MKPDRKLYLKDFEVYSFSSGFRHHLRYINPRFLPSPQTVNKTIGQPSAIELYLGFLFKETWSSLWVYLAMKLLRCKLIKIFQVIKLVGYHS